MTGAVNRDFSTCGLFADSKAGTELGEPRSADFVAGTATLTRRSKGGRGGLLVLATWFLIF